MPHPAPHKCKIAACQTVLPAQYSSDFCETHLKQRAIDKKRQRDAKKSKENGSATQGKQSTQVLSATRSLGNGNLNVENQKSEKTQDSSSSDDEVPSKRRKVSFLGGTHLPVLLNWP
jgi:hypothetical protein